MSNTYKRKLGRNNYSTIFHAHHRAMAARDAMEQLATNSKDMDDACDLWWWGGVFEGHVNVIHLFEQNGALDYGTGPKDAQAVAADDATSLILHCLNDVLNLDLERARWAHGEEFINAMAAALEEVKKCSQLVSQ